MQEDRVEAENQRNAANIAARMATQLDASQRKDRLAGTQIGLEIAKDIIKGGNDGPDRGSSS